nr:molybdate ABC transporter substrate-binding protein [Microbulbifer sediminum]
MRGRRILLSLILTAIVLPARAEEVIAAVASNFAAPMKVIAAAFEESTGHRVRLAFGSSGKIFAQVSNGAPFDIFLSADQAKPHALLNAGLAEPGSAFTYAIGRLVLWSPVTGRVSDGPGALREGGYRKLALANPRLAPYGAAAVQVLGSLELVETTRSRWVQGENISQAFQFVATGNAELGFVALSQVMKEGRIARGSGWVVPSSMHRPIRQDAVLLEQGAENPAARALLAFLRSPRSAALIESHGYQLPVSEE